MRSTVLQAFDCSLSTEGLAVEKQVRSKITGGYNLSAKYVNHTVSPVYKDGKHGEKALLESCYRESLALAKERNCETVAFPLLTEATRKSFTQISICSAEILLHLIPNCSACFPSIPKQESPTTDMAYGEHSFTVTVQKKTRERYGDLAEKINIDFTYPRG